MTAGLFDAGLVLSSWFDEQIPIQGWFDEDLIAASSGAPAVNPAAAVSGSTASQPTLATANTVTPAGAVSGSTASQPGLAGAPPFRGRVAQFRGLGLRRVRADRARPRFRRPGGGPRSRIKQWHLA